MTGETRTDAPADVVGRLFDTVAGLDEADPDDLLDALTVLRQVRSRLEQWEPALIGAARARGVTWSQLAPALGLASRQAAERRYLRLNPQPADEPGMTREHRVDIAREQRSADRAVAGWARQNAASLRALAGLISVLSDEADADEAVIDPRLLACVDRIRAALGGNDPAELVGPLCDSGPPLRTGHPVLADRVDAVTAAVDEVRVADRTRRGTPRRATDHPTDRHPDHPDRGDHR